MSQVSGVFPASIELSIFGCIPIFEKTSKMKKILVALFLILSYSFLFAQSTTEIKLDILGPAFRTIRISAERQFTSKFGLDIGFAQKWSKLSVDRTTFFPLVIDSNAMSFNTRDFEIGVMANFFPFAGEDHFVEFMVSPIAHASWRTYVAPDYYSAFRSAFAREAPDPYRSFPEFSIGVALGMQAEVFSRTTVESSLSVEWVFSDREGLNLTSVLSIKVGYILQAKENIQ